MAKKVLIVDDEENIVMSLEFLMQQAGFDVHVARQGEEAMSQIAAVGPDLVLLDVMLPRLNGYEICQKVRENPRWEHIKILMLSAKGREAEVAKGLALGANAYVTKPFSTKELVTRVQQILKDE